MTLIGTRELGAYVDDMIFKWSVENELSCLKDYALDRLTSRDSNCIEKFESFRVF